jgi:hypothetical protein
MTIVKYKMRSKLLQLRKPTLHKTAEKKLLNRYAACSNYEGTSTRLCYATEPKKK